MGDATQDEDHPYPGQQPQLGLEIGTTPGEFDRERPVAGWRTAGRGGDPAIVQPQAVVAGRRGRL